MFFPITEWARAFALTIVIEAPIVWVMLRPATSDAIRFAVLFMTENLATHLGARQVGRTVLARRSVERYDPAADTWSTLPDMPDARFTPDGVSLADGSVLLAGGGGPGRHGRGHDRAVDTRDLSLRAGSLTGRSARRASAAASSMSSPRRS
jgi:hypothetical protein